jgi:hypothetical protein
MDHAHTLKSTLQGAPRTGCEQLMTQLLGFGSEKHDDVVLLRSLSVLTAFALTLTSCSQEVEYSDRQRACIAHRYKEYDPKKSKSVR